MKVFISHSHNDQKFALAFSELLASIGFDRSKIFCSSISGQGVGPEEINNRIREELATSDLAFLIISDGFIKSAFCLNEMGAIWILDRVKSLPYYSIALSNISIEEIKGFINSNTKQYTLNIKDIKLLIESLLIKLDLKMSNSQLDNTAENFIEGSKSLITPGPKEMIEFIIEENDWVYLPSKEFPIEKSYIESDKKYVAIDPYIYHIKFQDYLKIPITKLRIYKTNWSGVKDSWFTHPDFNCYNLDNDNNLSFTERNRRKFKIQIW